jgi:hypothetical protein
MGMSTYKIFFFASVFSVLIPLVFYIVNIKKSPKQNHAIGILLFISGLCDSIGLIRFFDSDSNILLFNIFNVFQFVLLAYYYYTIMFKLTNHNIFYLGFAFYVLTFIILSLTTQSIFQYQNWLWSLSGAILIMYAWLYYNYAASRPTHIVMNPHLTSELYINGGVFFYFSLSLVLFVTVNYIVSEQDPEMSRVFWSFHNLNNIIKNVLFAVGIYFTGKRVITISQYEYESVKQRISTNE